MSDIDSLDVERKNQNNPNDDDDLSAAADGGVVMPPPPLFHAISQDRTKKQQAKKRQQRRKLIEQSNSTLPSPADQQRFRSVAADATVAHSQFGHMHQSQQHQAYGMQNPIKQLVGKHSDTDAGQQAVDVNALASSWAATMTIETPVKLTQSVSMDTGAAVKKANKHKVRLSFASQPAPAAPELWNKCTSFMSDQPPRVVFKHVVKVLRNQESVHLRVCAKKYQMKGNAVVCPHAVEFRVNVFMHPSVARRCIVEVELQRGERISFYLFFRDLICRVKPAMISCLGDGRPVSELVHQQYLCTNVPMVNQASKRHGSISAISHELQQQQQQQLQQQQQREQDASTVSSGLSPVHLSQPSVTAPPRLQTGCCVTLDEDTARALITMVSSRYVDVQREGLVSLCRISAESECNGHVLIQSSRLLVELQKVLQSTDWEVNRCAATLLANLSKFDKNHAALSATLLDRMFTLLAQPTVNRECRRQVARAVANVARTQAPVIAQRPEYVRIVSQCKHHDDMVIRQCATRCFQRLNTVI
eukprot:TRINITY_DN66358_c9_g1_i1.p1 TRINITY_DN66358_c9_g1~~TRINITY_DN66358_c9_g1_i1.p1  ORF type:complete len:532 (-),score=233.33 TRINITY_DN66358_c9_g1_i1:83-1678(-)